jgi:hypothetical protein
MNRIIGVGTRCGSVVVMNGADEERGERQLGTLLMSN